MSKLLLLDTALQKAHAAIAIDGEILLTSANELQQDHAAFIHTAIEQILKKTGLLISDIDAVAVTAGPGSYTGIRVGLSTAKGLCFAANKPLITINTLEVLAKASESKEKNILYCPMIDARRMEVFMAVYDEHFTEIVQPFATVLEENTLINFQNKYFIFSGNGCLKYQPLFKGKGNFIESPDTIHALGTLAYIKFICENFANIDSASPMYIKNFYDTRK